MRTAFASSFLLCILAIPGCLDPSADGNLVPKTADEDPSVPSIRLRDTTFHAESFGPDGAPVIVMLHGGPGGDYRGLLRLRNEVDGVRLEDAHQVVYWDQRGSGLSKRHDAAAITGAIYDADLDAIIDRFSKDRPVVLIGQSWGAMYATRYIPQHPEKIAGAVLMEPGPLTGALYEEVASGINHLDFFSEWLNDYTWAQRIVSPDDHARADYLLALGRFGDSEPGFHESTTDREPIWRMGAVASARVTREGIVDGEPAWDFTKGLDRFSTKVLFEASEENTVTGVAFQKRQMRFYPSAELAVIAGAGHDHAWTRPEQTLRPVVSYLAEIGF
jgi:proline iminopeptidase